MPPARKAVIDVGTNSVKVLVADVDGQQVSPVWEESKQTRLGRGFYTTHELQSSAIEETATAVADFARRSGDLQAQNVMVIGTSAARDAKNRVELVEAIRKASGLTAEVISGEQEAEWVFRGVWTQESAHGSKVMILDVGGGSTEIILGEKGHHTFGQSVPLGSVRLLEQIQPSDPPTSRQLSQCREWLSRFFHHEVAPAIETHLHERDRGEIQLVGTGGTASLLARMKHELRSFDREKIEQTDLSRKELVDWLEKLWKMPLEKRKQIVGLPPSRADIIPFGVAIYEAVMEHFGCETLRVSTRGLRFGALLGT